MKKKIITLVVLVIALSTIHLFAQVSDFTIETITGERLRSSDLLEKGPIFLNFWSTSCQPCLKEMPFISDFVAKYPDVSFIAVSTDSPRTKDNALRYVRSQRFAFTTGYDGSKALQRMFSVSSIPRTLIINQDGEIVYDHTGYNPGDEEEYEKQIQSLVNSD